jgi:hypothetical protein
MLTCVPTRYNRHRDHEEQSVASDSKGSRSNSQIHKNEQGKEGIREGDRQITQSHRSSCPNLAERNFYGGLLAGRFPRSPRNEQESTNPSVEIFREAQSINERSLERSYWWNLLGLGGAHGGGGHGGEGGVGGRNRSG